MERHFNQLSPDEAERLALLAEEAAEVIQVVGKILRHGYESHHPNGGPNNRALLEDELGDFEAAVSMLADADDVSLKEITDAKHDKLDRVKKYLHHQ